MCYSKTRFYENPGVKLCFTQDVAKSCFGVKMEYGDVSEKVLGVLVLCHANHTLCDHITPIWDGA